MKLSSVARKMSLPSPCRRQLREKEGGGQGGEAEGVADEGEGEGEGEVRRDVQHLFFFALAVASREAVREDNAAYETEFGCLQGVFVAPPRSDCDEVEGGGSGERWRMGVRMRMV